jgi:hypothetical protein
MINQAANAGKANDFPRRGWNLTGMNHGTISYALVGSLVIKIDLKFS